MPPVPGRLDEIKMIERIEESWLSQPYYRYYINEDVRKAKWNYNNYNLKVLWFWSRSDRNSSQTASFSVPSPYHSPTTPGDSTLTADWEHPESHLSRGKPYSMQIDLLRQAKDRWIRQKQGCKQNIHLDLDDHNSSLSYYSH